MSKFDEILSQYAKVIEELAPATPALDLTSLDQATGDQIQQGLAEIMGGDEAQMQQVLQGLVNSKSINPNAATAAPVQTQQAATAQVANQTSPAQPNPAAAPEKRALANVSP